MLASIVVIAGPARSGKTHFLLSRYRKELSIGKPASVLWLSPTWRAAAEVRNRLFAGVMAGCWGPSVLTFDKFAQAVLESSPDPIRPMTLSMKRRLVRHLIDEQFARGRLQYFRPIVSSSGLVDLVCEFISELKRLEIWPEDFRRACQARGYTAKDRELLELYDAYQLILRENQLYDFEGRFWSARDWLQRGQRRPFENLRLLVADGFTDFTRTQHEILELLAGWVEEIIISLPLESEPRRADLFTKSLKTLSELKRRHSQVLVQELPRREDSLWPAMSHLEKSLFINPRLARPAPSTEGIEILAARKSQGEMELIGARIKRLLAEGIAKPGDIAVVFRTPQDAAAPVAEVFHQLGIPFTLERGKTLDRVPMLRALTALLQLDQDDWPFRQLLAVIGNNFFQPDWPEWQGASAAKCIEHAIRKLQIPRGRKKFLEQLKDELVLSILNRLATAFEQLPVKAPLPQWAKAWEKLAQHTGLLRKIELNKLQNVILSEAKNLLVSQPAVIGHQSQDSRLKIPNIAENLRYAQVDNDAVAWNRLIGELMADNTLANWLNQRPPELDRREAFQALADTLRSQRLPAWDDESGRVRVLSAPSVRSVQIPHLFLAGLSEKAFPPPDREDRLYSEAEYLQLIDKGLPLVARQQRMQEEMLLFYEVVTRATRRLYLSYPALDDSAQPLLPSPYLLEIQQACGEGSILRTQRTDLRPVPAGEEPLSAAQFRVKALADALSGELSLLAGLLQSSDANNLLSGLEMIISRQKREGFGPAEGMLLGKDARISLAAEFSRARSFTASELEQYAACPYRFLLQNILKLEPLEELALQLDSLERGQIVHEVLALFHRRVNEFLGHPGSPLELDESDFARLLQNALRESLPSPSPNPLRNALREVDRRLITRWLADYRNQHQRYDKLWEKYQSPPVPEFFEASFGRSKHHSGAGSTDEPLEFFAGKETIRVAGRIDRIDTGKIADKNIYNVLDYKTGGSIKVSLENVGRGLALQLPLYCLAVAELLLNNRDALPWRAGYWHVSREGFKSQQALKLYEITDSEIKLTSAWEEIWAILGKTVAALLRGIRRGSFPVFNKDQFCTRYCPFSTVCRIGQIRSLEKTWQPTPP
jgi:ATP-dependent helicase/nuclease subunit B